MPSSLFAAPASRLQADIAAYGSLDVLCQALVQDGAAEALAGALAYRHALAERAQPAVRARRLRLQAGALDAEAAAALAQSAEFHGKAAYRAAQGEWDLAAAYAARAHAADRLAVRCERQAAALRAAAADAQAGADFAEHLTGLPYAAP